MRFHRSCFIFAFCYSIGSALMSIVGVYKEIQDQHMNIVSINLNEKKRKKNLVINLTVMFVCDICS